jgi:predicted MFS family arabinose efflux permease
VALVLAVLIGLAGMLVSPALATAYVLTDSLALPKARNRAGNWVNSSYNAGSSAGAVLSGQLVGTKNAPSRRQAAAEIDPAFSVVSRLSAQVCAHALRSRMSRAGLW